MSQNLVLREGSPLSLGSTGARSLRELAALNQIDACYRKHDGPFGLLGLPTAAMQRGTGSYIQPMSNGAYIEAPDGEPQAKAFSPSYRATISVTGVKCFGTDDPSGKDEIQVTVAVTSLQGVGETKVLGGDDGYNIREQQSLQLNEVIARDVMFADDGLSIYVQVWDRELGRTDKIEKKVRAAVAATGHAFKTMALGKLSSITSLLKFDGKTVITDALMSMAWDQGMEWLGDGLTSLMDKIAGDDLVGQCNHILSKERLSQIWANYDKTLVVSEAGSQANIGVPPNDPLLENGDGSYKVYLRIQITQGESFSLG